MTFHTHWREVPAAAWRWPNFSPAEIACRGTGKLLVNEAALDKLQALRDRLGKPLIVRSAYRSPEHNRAVGGAKASKHIEGIAFDIAMANHDPEAFEAAARAVGFQGFGFYPRSGFMHIDLGPARQLGRARSRSGATAFAAETPPAREVLAESRTLKGGGAAGVATIGAAGVEVAQEVLAETQGAILPLVPYLDTLRWAVHRGGARRHRGRDLRAAGRLEAEAGGDHRTDGFESPPIGRRIDLAAWLPGLGGRRGVSALLQRAQRDSGRLADGVDARLDHRRVGDRIRNCLGT